MRLFLPKFSQIFNKLTGFCNFSIILEAFFYILIIILTFQTKFIYLTENSEFKGNFVFYNTYFLMISDIVIFLLIGIWLFSIIFQGYRKIANFGLFYLLLAAFLAISTISVYVSYETVKIFGLIKLFLLFLLFSFIINNVNVKRMFHVAIWLNLAVSIFQAFLGLFQYFKQSSLGLKILGEEFLKPYLGVAKFKILYGYRWIIDKIFNINHDSLIMRPYGTFSHPNVFGAFMVFSCLLSYYLFLVSHETRKRVIVSFAIIFQILAVFLSFSRVAILAWILGTLIWFGYLFVMKLKTNNDFYKKVWEKIRPLGIIVFASAIVSVILFYPQYLERSGAVSYGTSNREAVSDRVLYQKISLEMIKKHPIAGVGFLNFVNTMENYSPTGLKDFQRQPVHNIYLLIAAELGLPGIFVFLSFLAAIFYRVCKSKPFNFLTLVFFSIFTAFIFIGFFDHYLYTIQQGRLAFFLTAGLLVASLKLPEEEIKSE